MSCKFCERNDNDFIPINETVEYSGIEIEINRQGMLRVRYYDDPAYGLAQDIVNISFCPMCGRKFMEEE